MLKRINLRSLLLKSHISFSEMQQFSSTFLSATNATYIEHLYSQWLSDPSSVHSSWHAYFLNEAKDLPSEQSFSLPNQLSQFTFTQQDSIVNQSIRIQMMKLAYQQYGHQLSTLDPLGLDRKIYQQAHLIEKFEEASQRLNPEYYGFSKENMQQEYSMFYGGLGGFNRQQQPMKLQDIYNKLKKVYTGNVGYEFTYIDNQEQKNWILDQIEQDSFHETSKERKLEIFSYLCENNTFNEFLKNKFPTSKRFGIEGCDTSISALKALVSVAGQEKLDHLVFGMAHRGRLNTLALVMRKPFEEIFAEIKELKYEQSHLIDNEWGKMGDVKYHLGITHDQQFENGHSLRTTILPNPSHLETVDPVVYGKVRALQDFDEDLERRKNIGIVLHGDAAHAGQGVVYETYQFQDLKCYTSGGIIHIITNNQIGFTTTQRDARSGLYCTEVAKTIMAPIFHVNADDPIMVDKVIRMSLEYRQKFNKDVVIDIVGYRKYGHNELDQPLFTQPLMYKKINNFPNVYQIYSEQLLKEGIISKEQIQKNEDELNKEFNNAYEVSRKDDVKNYQWVPKPYEEIKTPQLWGHVKNTGVPQDTLKEFGHKISKITGVNAHPQIQKIYEQRYKSISEGGIDFGTAEALAFYTLLHEGYGVRLSGQDVERGTFSHRHAVVHDQEVKKDVRPIDNALDEVQRKRFTVTNSHLSEYGVLGFEYGYNITNPNSLVIWEAQFGDFANTAQILIDNYIVSGETKWKQQSGIVMMLPHGMDGNGPEHSSARLERYLQLSDDNYFIQKLSLKPDGSLKNQINNVNIQIACPTTSANYFHLLRRQMRRMYRKPLVVMASKRLLRFRGASSSLEEMEEGKRFKWVIGDDLKVEGIKKVFLCSGQVYYDILERRQQENRKDIAIIRLEQLSPFPYNELKSELSKYRNCQIQWVQEEHMNQGAWGFVKQRIPIVLEELKFSQKLGYIGRRNSASSATGSHKTHVIELKEFLDVAFTQ